MKVIVSIILIFLSIFSYGQELECKKFKNGTFKIIDPELGNFLIMRKGSQQIEYAENTQVKVKFKVKWISDCSYTIEFMKILENPQNIQFPDKILLTVKILETSENSYLQETSSEMFDSVLQTEMIKIE